MPLEVTGVSRVLPLLCRYLYAAVAQVFYDFLRGSCVTHHIVLAVEEERRSSDRGAQKGTDARVKVVHCVALEDPEVKQARLSYQCLQWWKYSFPKS